MIQLRGVMFGYRPDRPVLSVESLDVDAGLTLVVGRNGCGKSTLLRMFAGVEKPDTGTVAIDGHDLWSDAGEVPARMGLAYAPEHPDLTPYASVGAVLDLVAQLRSEPASRAEDALRWIGLTGLGRRSVRELSLGQKRRVHLAAARIGRPSTLILDEPLESLDAAARSAVLDWVGESLDRGARAIVATHELEPFLDRAVRVVSFERTLPRADAVDVLEPAERAALVTRLASEG